MGSWGTSIKSNDAFADVYGEFFDLYNKGGEPGDISKKILADNREIIESVEEKQSLWFALALAQWETKSLDPEILATVEEIISSGADLGIWRDLGGNEQTIEKRRIALAKFLEKIKSERPKAKPRKRTKFKVPIFETGECLVFRMTNGNYGGAVILASNNDPETACNLVALTRINNTTKPTLKDFQNAEVLICNFANWQDEPKIDWCWPDNFHQEYSAIYEAIGKLTVEIEYESTNTTGEGYHFNPSYTAAWNFKSIAEMQFDSETTKPKTPKTLTIKQLTKKPRWWNPFS